MFGQIVHVCSKIRCRNVDYHTSPFALQLEVEAVTGGVTVQTVDVKINCHMFIYFSMASYCTINLREIQRHPVAICAVYEQPSSSMNTDI